MLLMGAGQGVYQGRTHVIRKPLRQAFTTVGMRSQFHYADSSSPRFAVMLLGSNTTSSENLVCLRDYG